VLTVEQPVIGENAGVSWFTASLPNGENVGSGITITLIELKTNSYDITFSNANSFDVNINQLSLWAQPAKNISIEPTVYDSKDTDSILKYEEQTETINNNFIQSISQAESLALTMLDEYSEYADIISMEVKGNPALQLSDIIEVYYQEYTGQYRIIKISNTLQDQKFTQILKCKRYTPRNWFQLNVSTLNGASVLAP